MSNVEKAGLKSITLKLHDGRTCSCTLPFPECEYVVASKFKCECSRAQDLQVAGYGDSHNPDDRTTESKAGCARCGGSIGTLIVKHNTLFGIEEDRRVTAGRCRVY